MTDATRNLLEQHFDTAFAAPDGIAKLRELILRLAMQGKLVEQDAHDPPASELLKEVEAEKQRLVKAGKIKQPKPLPPIKPEEMPYELPQGWEWVRLGEIGVWKSGSTPSRSNASFYGGDIPWVKSGEVKQGRIKSTEENITHAALDKCPLQINEKGSVLVAMYGANIGEVGILEIEAASNQAVCACKTYTNFDENYLLYLITSLKPYFLSQGAGAAQPNISREKIVATIFPLPPAPEQHRIVARIDQLMARCDELEKLRKERETQRLAVHAAAIKQLLEAKDGSAWDFIQQHFGELYTVKENVAELRKAILQLAVMGRLVPQDPNAPPASVLLQEIEAEKQRLVKAGKIKKPKPLPPIKPEEVPYELPLGWEWVRLGGILCFGPTNGFSPRAVDYETPVRSLTLSATTSGVFKGEYSKFITDEIPEDSTLWLEDGDILVQRGNTLDYVGVPAVYRGKSKQFIYPDLMMKIRVFDKICTDFTHRALSAETSRNYLRNNASGTSSTMPKINQSTLCNLLFPIPPLTEQHRIVTRIDQLMALCDTLDQKINCATSKQTELLNAVMAQV